MNIRKKFSCTRNFWGENNPRELTRREFEACQAICGECEVAWDCFDANGDPLPFDLAGELI